MKKRTEEYEDLSVQAEHDESLRAINVNMGRFSHDGHSWNGKPFIDVWKDGE